MVCLLALLILQLLYPAEGFFLQSPKMQTMPHDGGDPGAPLFLTPYVEGGNITEGQRLARVTLPDVPDIESYSGFFTVNKTYNSNLFFWYFPSTDLDSPFCDVMIYLQGFPGVTSLYGQFEEHGPIEIQEINSTKKFNPRTWHLAKFKNLIYIDPTVGTGFSFTNDSLGYCTDQTQVGEQLYAAVVQIFQLFPELQKHKLYITGELYAGKYATALAHIIQQRNPTADVKINLNQLTIGSGWCDPINQLLYHNSSYQIGIHDWHMVDKIKEYEDIITELIQQEKWLDAAHYFKKLMEYMQTSSGNISFYNFIKDVQYFEIQNPKFVALVQTSQVRKALHVGDLEFQDGTIAQDALKPDLMKSVAPWISELLQDYQIIFYGGILGAMVPFPSTINFITKIDPTFANNSTFMILAYMPDNMRVFGLLNNAYHPNVKYSNLTSFLIMTVGNLPAHDDPEWAWTFIDGFAGILSDDVSERKHHTSLKKVAVSRFKATRIGRHIHGIV